MRVITLNVWALSEPFSRDTGARMRAIGEALGPLELDVAAFQELWTQPARAELVAAGRRAGLIHVWHPEGTWGGSGLAVLSRLPILDARLHRFRPAGVAERIHQADYLGGKGFTECVLDTPRGEITLIDTHLQAAYAPRERYHYVPLRTAQVVQLADHLRRIERPLILAGDLNLREESAEYSILTGLSGVTDAAAALDRRQDTWLPANPYTSEETDPPARIDYLFSRAGRERVLTPISIERVFDETIQIANRTAALSDHAGLIGEFEIAAGREPLAPVNPKALKMARTLVQEGRDEVQVRQRRQRAAGWFGLALFPASLFAARWSRRRFL
ncbi:MAG: endonuclease/exonuclease/phosphatase family protein, partial [Myxococcota bacterium]|nr:endonuclease/exonuclease/phosphatase family protein [Myxococcota bacterium]